MLPRKSCNILGDMDTRTRGIIRTLTVSLVANAVIAIIKIVYGRYSHSLAFTADGVHSLFDSASLIFGMTSVLWASQPADEGHPYGHHKFETLSATAFGVLLLIGAAQVGATAYERFLEPNVFPRFNTWGLVILAGILLTNIFVAKYEAKCARELSSQFLASDSLHNAGDMWTTLGVFGSILSGYFQIPFVDAFTSLAITLFLIYLSGRLILQNMRPLLDHSVLDSKRVEEIARSVAGVLDAHQIRSRGERGNYFLDLNIHLPGKITLEKAHDITHEVESRLKTEFPELVDVVIHTEPHGHKPCLPSPTRKV